MYHAEIRLAEIQAHQQRLRSERAQERASPESRRPIRRRVGESIIRLGRRVAGEGLASPALSG